MTIERDIEFIHEIGSLRLLHRTWRQFFLPHVANVSEHTFRVIWIALFLAKKENVTDTKKVIEMALVHDIVESRTNDVNYLSRQFVTRDEKSAIDEMLSDTAIADFKQIFLEYRKMDSIEAKVVKDADNLDVDFEINEHISMGNCGTAKFKQLRKAVYNRLHTRSAKEFWKSLRESDPHAWHLNASNRINAGDWKD